MAKKKFDDFDDILIDDEIVTTLPTSDTSNTNVYGINLIKPNPHQPRFNEDVEELKAAIKAAYDDLLIANVGNENITIQPEDGLLQPILITPNDDGTFTCVGGHRRLKACTELDHRTIKANLVVLDETQLITFSIMENLQRVDLTPFETALAVDKAIASGSFKSEGQLATALGKTSSWISKCKSVLKLSTVILDDLHKTKNKIGLEILNDLQRLQSSATAEDLYFKYQAGDIKGSDIREAIKEEKEGATRKAPMLSRKGKTITLSIDCSDDGQTNINLDHLYIDIHNHLEKLKEDYNLLQDLEQSEIKYMEVLKNNVYLEFAGGDSRNVPFSVAKNIIKNVHYVQMKINYSDCSNSETGSNFLNSLPGWSHRFKNDTTFLIYDAK